MGAIKKILLNKDLPDRELHNSRMFVDLSENIHIHFREIRMMFGVEEFFEFFEILKEGARDIKKYLRRNPDYQEQQVFDGILVGGGAKRQIIPLKNSPKPHESKYYPNRLQVELQEESVIDAIHIHYRDYRFVMNIETFREFSNGMKAALDNLDEFLRQYDYKEGAHPFRTTVTTEEWNLGKITLLHKIKYKIKRILGRTETN
ncbi:MAG: hypothetical protein NT166_21340 [Candidatus Aminicenantes bacterium]|nr:hypothetical protein [Candidatus Aminicenantes bacterium]